MNLTHNDDDDDDNGHNVSDHDSPPSRPAAAFHPKRPHKKSRTGCRNCKLRKVKCNEERPQCRSCFLRKESCQYHDPPLRRSGGGGSSGSSRVRPNSAAAAAAAASVAGRAPTPSSSVGGSALSVASSPSSTVSHVSPPRQRFFGGGGAGEDADSSTSSSGGDPADLPIIAEPAILFPGRDMTELQLLWFYTNKTFTSFVAMERIDVLGDILKVRVVQHAFETPFLMDCILGLSAMQMRSLGHNVIDDPRRQLVYQSRAFSGYRKAIEEAKPETFPGLIACSIMFTALSSTIFREGTPGVGRLKIISWIVIWRGIGLLVDLISPEELLKSGMAPLFFRPTLELGTDSPSFPEYLRAMVDSIGPNNPEARDISTYRNALRYLGALYSELSGGITPILFLQVMSWFTYLPTRFVSLVRQERPRALVIVAHVCAFLKFVPMWWMENVGQYGMEEIIAHVCPEWSEFMAIPLNAVALGAATDSMRIVALARVLLRDPHWLPPHIPVIGKPQHDPRVKGLTWVDDEGRAINWEEEGFKPTNHSDDFEPTWNIDFPSPQSASAGTDRHSAESDSQHDQTPSP
jgi:hypothetical protein